MNVHKCNLDSPNGAILDYVEVARVIEKYSEAGIPLETMWTDIGTYRCLWVQGQQLTTHQIT